MGVAANDASKRGETKSPKQQNKPSASSKDGTSDVKSDTKTKTEASSNATTTKPLAPPPRPGQQGTNTPDFFTSQSGGSLSLEPNPFEQSFGGSGPETPGGTKLPSVAALTSPSALLQGSTSTPFTWGGGSLRTGPLSPAMLSGPTNDYFSDNHHMRSGFTPNESSLRSGLTPGGSGSMFPAASPNSQAIFAQLAGGGATPSTLDFHRTALSAASKQNQAAIASTSQAPAVAAVPQPQEMANGAGIKTEAKAYDPHDNDAANGLFLLAQGRNNNPVPAKPTTAKANANTKSTAPMDAADDAINAAEDGGAKPNTRGKGKKGAATAATAASTTARRKAEELPAKAPPAKKSKASAPPPPSDEGSDEEDGDDDDENGPRSKMTDEEKRKNFLERNRVAALKCRQRKKQWLANLQAKVEMFSTENDALSAQITQLREEVVNLKTMLLAHKDCPVTQQQGIHGAFMSQVVEPFNGQMNPYGMAPGMPNQQQVMAGQGVQRRFS